MTDSNLSPENEKLKNTGIKDIPRVLKEKLFDNTGAIMFPEQIQSKTVADYERNIENVLRPKGQKDDQLFRAGLAATFDGTENAINFAGRIISGISGNKYTAKDYFDNEALGIYIPEEDEDSLTYNLAKFGVQYGVPYTTAFKVLGAAGLSNWAWRDVLASGTTASIFFDTFAENFSNMVQDSPLANPVTGLLAAKTEEESNVFIESIKKFIEAGTMQKVANLGIDAALNPSKVADAFIDITKAFRKSPKVANDLIFNLRQSRFNKFENIRKFNGMDEALSKGDDLIDIAPVADDVVTKTPTQIDLPDTRGQGKFYHGSAKEIVLEEGGEAVSSQNIYGNGFYTTDDLVTGSGYKKKNRTKGEKPSGVVYEITEKQPVNFYNLDQPVDAELKTFINNFNDDPFDNIVSEAVNDLGDNYTLTQLFDEIRGYANSRNISSSTVIDEIFGNFQEYFTGKGFGGFTHQGGKLAGKNKRLHQVRIYFDPANQIDINKVDLDQLGAVADDTVLVPKKKIRSKKGKQKFQTTDTPVGFEGRNFFIFGDDPNEIAKIKAAYNQELNEYYPKYKNIVTDDMLIEDADDYLDEELFQDLKKFTDEYGYKLPVMVAATVRRITGLAVNLSDGSKLIKTLPVGSKERDILKRKLLLQTINFYRMTTRDSRSGTVLGRALRSRKLGTAKNPVTGQTPGEVTASNIEARRAEDLKGGGSEIIRDIGEDIDNTFKSLEFSQEDVLKALEEDRFDDFADFASKLAAAHGDPLVLQKLVKESIGMKGLKITNEVFLNGILSNPATHVRNTLGTMLNVVTGPADLLIGSSTRQELFKGQFVDPILFRRAMAEFAMFKQAQSDALKLAGQAFKENRNILDRSRMIVDSGNDPTQRFAIQKRGGTFDGEGLQKIKNGKDIAQYLRRGLVPDLVNSFGTINNAPLRALIAEDEYNKQLAFRMFLKGELVEDGLRKGLTGKAFDDYVDKSFELGVNWIAKKGSELDLALKEIQEFKPFIGPNGEQVAVGEDLFLKIRDSLDYAADRTFTTKIDNKIVNALKSPGWKPILPFINSPLNIQQTVLKRTPLMATITGKVPLLEGMLDTHRKQLQSSVKSVAGRARGVERIGGGVWLTFASLSMFAADRFAKIALVDGTDPDWRQDKIRKYSGDPGYAFRILLTNPVTKKPQLGPDGQPRYHFVDCGRIGFEPFSSMCRVAGYYGTIQKYLDDEDQKNVAAVMTIALARDILDIPMFEAVQKLMDIIENKPDALPNFLANYMNSAFIPYSSLRKAIKKTDYSYIDPRSGKKLRGYFKPDKSIQKGDYIKQNIRTKFDDGTPIPKDHPAYGTLVTENPRFLGDFFVRKVALKFMKELQSSNPLAERLKPQKFWLTGQNLEYPQNIGINSGMNPSLEGSSLNDPVVSLVRRSKSKITPPPAHLFRNSAEGGILLNSTQYEKLKEFIYETKLDNNNQISSKGKTVYQKLLPIAKDKKILELLDFIESGEVDDNFNIDTKAVLTSRENSVKDLRKLLREIITPYIGQAKLQLFQLEDEKGGAKSKLPAYLKEKRRQKLDLQNRYTR